MKKRLLIYAAALIVAAPAIGALKRVPTKVQGIDYASTLPKDTRAKIAKEWEWDPNPDAPALPATEFTFDDIQNWTGEGANKAALVIQWNDDRETNALVFGYRWDGMATGTDMIKAVVKNNPRLYALMQYTNVSSPTDPNGGYTINGFGWDADNDGDIALIDTKDNQVYESEDGFFEHPRGYVPGQGGSSDYDYDDWEATDEGDFWGAGWYLSYWSYWVGTMGESLSYSSWGASGRVLEDGCCDGWNFAIDMMASDWKDFKAAPSTIPDGAKTEFKNGDFYYQLVDYSKGTVRLVDPSTLESYKTETMKDFAHGTATIPESFYDEESDKTYTVVEIGDKAFYNGYGISHLILPASVRKIGAEAFYASELIDITGAPACDLSKTITSIGEDAFALSTQLTTPVFPEEMKSLPKGIYRGTRMPDVLVIPAHIEEIGEQAFMDYGDNGADAVSEKAIVIPASVKKIGAKAFNSSFVKKVTCESLYPAEISEDTFGDSTYAEGTLTVPTGFKEAYAAATGWSRFANVTEAAAPVEVGDVFPMNGATYEVTSVGETKTVKVRYAKFDGDLSNNNIKAANQAAYTGDIVIPATVSFMGHEFTVTEMSDRCFYYAEAVTSVNIQAAIEMIPENAFYNCTALTTATLPSTIKSIDTYAFAYCKNLTALTLPEGIEILGERAFFSDTKLGSINIPTTVKEIKGNCFYGCSSLTSMHVGDNVTTLGTYVFRSCTNLKEVSLPSGLVKIPDYSFDGCSSLETFEFPEATIQIGASAFKNCKKFAVPLPERVTGIWSEAFAGTAYTSFTFPEAIKEIPAYVLDNCTNLTEVKMSAGVTSIGNYAFRSCSSLEEFNFPTTLTSIGQYAFNKCSKLKKALLPEGIRTIGASCFTDCAALTAASIPSTVTTLGNYMFQNCATLAEVTLPDGLTSIGTNSFRDCKTLAKIRIAGEEENEDTPAFMLPSALKTINTWAFANCVKLESIVIPEGVTSIPANTFDGCTALKEIKLPSRLTTIGNYAFRNTAITELVLPATVGNMPYVAEVVKGCPAELTVYVCNTGALKTVGSSTWRLGGTNAQTYTFAKIVVPSGKKAAYEAANNWKNSAISEPVVSAMDFDFEESDSADNQTAEILVSGKVTYAGTLPAMFAAANDALLFAGETAEFQVSRRIAEEDAPANLRSGDYDNDPELENLTLDADGTASVTFERPKKDTSYAFSVTGTHAAGTTVTEEKTVKVKGSDTVTGVEEIESDSMLFGDDAEIYTLDGVRIEAARLVPGLYIVKTGSKTAKVLVK